MSNLRDEIDEILRNKIEIQFPESLAPNPVVIYGEAFEALTALFNKHVEELLPEKLEIRDDQLPNHILYAKGYNQALDDIKAKLKE